ncbi:MAG: hypothetical protein AAF735_06185 [Myxococcota bacterium]
MQEELETRFGAESQRYDLDGGEGTAKFWCVADRVALVALWGRASMDTVRWTLERHDEVKNRCEARGKRMYLALWYGGLSLIDPGTRQALASWCGKNRDSVSRVVAISHDPIVRMAGFTINMLFGNTGRMAKTDREFLDVVDGWVRYIDQQSAAR